MKMLREDEKRERISGLGVPRGKTMLHRFFADDSGVAVTAEKEQFKNLQKTIELFEEISGAQLNLSKSVIVPMAMRETPNWLVETGCTILREREQITYLGSQIGYDMSEKEYARLIADKLTRKLANWTHRQNGGLQLKPFEVVATALKTKLVARLLAGDNSEWSDMLMLLADRYLEEAPYEFRVLNPILKKMGSAALMNLKDGAGRWIDISRTSQDKGITVSQEANREISKLQRWLQKVELSPGGLKESPSWRWRTDEGKWGGWQQSTRFWTHLLMSSTPHSGAAKQQMGDQSKGIILADDMAQTVELQD
ncbi:hypothetical protein R1sor_002651 [Riccia sorocarpa]|uniref:Reverse transcriptase domain-containing protein n=1 Tax=Riccia sorocarpa TaxID=122646 RepID=A0ABD3H246_9MARC